MNCPEGALLTVLTIGIGIGCVVTLVSVAVARALDFWRANRWPR